MNFINQTWPHPNHVLVNAGRAGCSLQCFLFLECLEDSLPHSMDLLLIENMMVSAATWAFVPAGGAGATSMC